MTMYIVINYSSHSMKFFSNISRIEILNLKLKKIFVKMFLFERFKETNFCNYLKVFYFSRIIIKMNIMQGCYQLADHINDSMKVTTGHDCYYLV